MLAQIPEPDPAGQPVGQQLVRRPGHQDLTTMAGREQPGDPVHHRTEIVPVALQAGPRMQRHAHPDGQAGRPRLSTGSPLDSHRRRQRGGRVGEHRTKRLAHRLEDVTACHLDLFADNAVMAGQRLRHGLGVGLPQPDAALDVGEQQRHRSRGEPHSPIVHPRSLPLLPFRRRSNGLGLVASSSEALLGALFGESVARADLIPGGTGLAGGLNLGGLQLLGRFSQVPRSFESANRSVGDVESAERRGDPPDGTLGGHHHSVFDNRYRSMIR